MAIGAKRKRPFSKGLPPGERLKRDKLDGAEVYSQWGWVSRVTDASHITLEHRLAAYGFTDKVGKPICKNKYTESSERERKRQKVAVVREVESRAVPGENDDDIIIISSDDEELFFCDKKYCKENPQCVNYLGQVKLENQDGALQAFLESSQLGPSPLDNAREPDLPIGLKVMHLHLLTPSFTQVWFQDHAFRDGVYRCKPSEEEGEQFEDSPIFQLQVTFAALQEITQNVFNPIKLVESLQLRATEQQDAQEFSKLFMSHLATEFEKQAVPPLKTLLADQFQGNQTYGTMCKQCCHRSEHDTDFLELEINLEANGKLEERIEALLQSEELTGDNKYYCTRCDSLQDAVRYTKLRRLPPVLHFSVLRFVFDLTTLSRKKSKHAIMFPPVLDMSPFVETNASEESEIVEMPLKRRYAQVGKANQESNLTYELRGVLLHKGPSAYHGHYEAQVFDVITKQFYQFNDETVTSISSLQPKASSSTKNAVDENYPLHSVSTAANKRRRTYTRKKRRVDDSDGEAEKCATCPTLDHNPTYVSSKDAYMLIYARREAISPNPLLLQPPPLARERVANLNRLHDDACASYIDRESKLTAEFKYMREQKMDVYHHWQIDDIREESAVVSRSALEDWLAMGLRKPEKEEPIDKTDNRSQTSRRSSKTSDIVDQCPSERSESPSDPLDLLQTNPPTDGFCLDNSSIICQHGRLDPNKAGHMKRIKKGAVTSIRTQTGCFFDPELTVEDICQSCVASIFMEKRYALDHISHVAQFDELCESEIDIDGVWISKAWLKDWKQSKPKMHVIGQEDPAPDSAEYANHARCAHGQLSLSSSSRKWINGQACTFLQSLFPTWHPTVSRFDDPRICTACDEDLSMSKEARQELKQQVDKEKEKLKGIFPNVLAFDPEFDPGVCQAIICADFLRQWRSWIGRPHEKPRPGAIDNTQLICKHNRLVIDPNVSQDLGSSVSVISLSDWQTLHELYGGGPLIRITGLAPNSQGSQDSPIVMTNDFETCLECRADRLSNFEAATISIRILSDAPNPTPERSAILKNESTSPCVSPKGKANGPTYSRERKDGRPLRTSTRLRNSKQKVGRKHITIKKLSTVKDIKIEVQEELEIPTICQRLFFKGRELTDNQETVASLGILANDTLDLWEAKENDDAFNSDVEPEFHCREEGRAFGGTILSGVAKKASSEKDRGSSPEAVLTLNHCPVCTFINEDDQSTCDMCGSKTDG
ncbi:cysteine proteinase [Ramaria rubella]|nr:cysteine proteinase [Ramaria rubella]